jgi:hypothetical protein
VAGCAGSGFRRIAVVTVAWIAAGSAIAQVPPPANAATAAAAHSGDTKKVQGRQRQKMDRNTKVETNPDAALIEYLGEYGDAADGLDPMGLADPDAVPRKSGDGKG